MEGTKIEDIFFIEKGEFEVTKYIFVHKKRNLIFYEYLRFNSINRDEIFLKKLLNDDTRIVYSPNENEFDIFKVVKKGLPRKNIRISSLGENECFGLTEGYLNTPYSVFTITCKSRDAVLHRISRNEMSMKLDLKMIPSVRNSVQDKLLLFAQRMRTTTKEFGINIEYELSDLGFKDAVLPPDTEYVPPKDSESDSDSDEDTEGRKDTETEGSSIAYPNDYASLRDNKKIALSSKNISKVNKKPKRIITDASIREHIDSCRSSLSPSSVRRTRRIRNARFTITQNLGTPIKNSTANISKFVNKTGTHSARHSDVVL